MNRSLSKLMGSCFKEPSYLLDVESTQIQIDESELFSHNAFRRSFLAQTCFDTDQTIYIVSYERSIQLPKCFEFDEISDLEMVNGRIFLTQPEVEIFQK